MSSTDWYDFSFANPTRGTTYYAIASLDSGGFGDVWAGLDNAGIPIAIKIIRPTSDPVRDFINWFTEQDICLRCLTHPHIVTTFDQFECQDGTLVIVMERAEGSLRHYLSKYGQLNPLLVCSIGIQLCAALAQIHQLGVIHRDVTLNNVLWYANGVFKLSDFGISRQTVSGEDFAHTFIGFRNAIPPELLTAGYSTTQSDIYQLGIVLLTLLTGTEPIPANQPVANIKAMIADGVPRQTAESLVPQHGRLAEILSVMLRRTDAWRYQTATDVRRDLEEEFARQDQYGRFADWLVRRQQSPLHPPTTE